MTVLISQTLLFELNDTLTAVFNFTALLSYRAIHLFLVQKFSYFVATHGMLPSKKEEWEKRNCFLFIYCNIRLMLVLLQHNCPPPNRFTDFGLGPKRPKPKRHLHRLSAPVLLPLCMHYSILCSKHQRAIAFKHFEYQAQAHPQCQWYAGSELWSLFIK